MYGGQTHGVAAVMANKKINPA
ncbi:hypothetical protein YPPY94_1868, partial [Yersinia pestis PY-94]